MYLPRAFPAKFLALALVTATPAFAETTVVCDLEPNGLVVQDSSTILTFDESARTISGRFGGYHYSDPSFQGRVQEEPLPPVAATFADQDIVFYAPAGFSHASGGDKFDLNRLTGELQHFVSGGYRSGDVQRCRPATKQF